MKEFTFGWIWRNWSIQGARRNIYKRLFSSITTRGRRILINLIFLNIILWTRSWYNSYLSVFECLFLLLNRSRIISFWIILNSRSYNCWLILFYAIKNFFLKMLLLINTKLILAILRTSFYHIRINLLFTKCRIGWRINILCHI